MKNQLGNSHEENIFANNEKIAKWNEQTINPNSKVKEAKLVYK